MTDIPLAVEINLVSFLSMSERWRLIFNKQANESIFHERARLQFHGMFIPGCCTGFLVAAIHVQISPGIFPLIRTYRMAAEAPRH